jgi:hypothetical protein
MIQGISDEYASNTENLHLKVTDELTNSLPRPAHEM